MENKTGKYFKYAIGEVVLVVIGILIALSINNWNSKKELSKEESRVLTKIHSGLMTDLEDINWCIDYHTNYLATDSLVLNQLSGNKEINGDTLAPILSKYLTTNSTILLSFSAFEQLKNRDPKLISNDPLLQEISDLYVIYYPLIIDMENYNAQYQPENQIEDYIKRHLTIDRISNKIKIKDITALENDQEFELSLITAISNREHLLQQHQENLIIVNKLITNIENYLKTKG